MAEQHVPNPDPNIVLPAPGQPVGHYFPDLSPPPNDDTFEFGLVLGGTVSAAAYTAGVLDFLIEALDAWTLAKQAGDSLAPHHNVVIRIATGTSGGALTSVLLARTIGSAFFYGRYRSGQQPGLRARAVQVYLTYKGFSPGAIDGIAGTQTTNAIEQFQKSVGLPPSGVVDDQLIAQLAA